MNPLPAAPGPGSWALDAAHCERPHSHFLIGLGFDRIYTEGLRASAERYGLLIDTIEARFVDGFLYTCPRPIGAPPGAAPPPRWLLWLLCRLHPGLRARVARAEQVMATRCWRADVDDFRDRHAAAMRERCLQFSRTDLRARDDAGLIAELDAVARVAADDLFDHFRLSGACMLPVGDFLAHAAAWTGCAPAEALALLTGASPDSVDAIDALQAAARAVCADADACAILATDAPAGDRLAALRTREATGPAVEAWLSLVGERIVTGHDVAELRAIELPGALIDSLRVCVAAAAAPDAAAAPRAAAGVDAAHDALRARVPPDARDRFDALLADARAAHPLRDARSVFDFWCMGLLRRVILEVGQRLAARGQLDAADHAVDCTQAELASLLLHRTGPEAAVVAERVGRRLGRSCADMPDVLGPPPAPPPAPEWLPSAAGRISRAFGVYLEASFQERQPSAPHHAPATPAPGPRAGPAIEGIAASPGIARGPARLVHSPADFARVQEGDVLVARITTPAYNVLLPLLAAVVTERGGVLSHPAIVSREFGLPAVVGARGALDALPEGAVIEVDGHTGAVWVLP